MPSWPGTLPPHLPRQLREMPGDGREGFQPDAGPAIDVRRFTASSRVLEFRLTLTVAQRATLETFYRTTLKDGALEFDWTNPATATGFAGIHYFKFVDRPTYDWSGALRVATLRIRTRPGL